MSLFYGASFLAGAGVNVSPLFGLLTSVLLLAVLLSLLFVRWKQSLLLAYLLTGLIIGNLHFIGLSVVEKNDPVIANLAEIGVILLMFTLGIEFSLGKMKHMWRMALLGGGGQMILTALLVGCIFILKISFIDALVLGVAVAVSSTAVALKSFQDLNLRHHPSAKASLGIALFQDLAIIIFFLVMPTLYGSGKTSIMMEMAQALGKGILFLAFSWFLGRYGLTPLLNAVSRTRSRELFTLTVICICTSIALAGNALHLSFALGAFAAGLVVSETIYNHRILSDILPFKDLFLAIFFISIGLWIDFGIILTHLGKIISLSALVLFIKFSIVLIVLKWMKLPIKSGLLAAASLASTGEFSLVLIGKAGGYRPLDPAIEQMLLICTATTMGVVPSMMRFMIPFGNWLEKKGWINRNKHSKETLLSQQYLAEIEDHAIICGFGVVGQALNEALKRCGVSTLVMELNVETVKQLKKSGQPVLFCDASHPEALDLASIERAKMIAFTFPSIELASAAALLVRERNPQICILGRAKFSSEADRLRALGVEVIHDEHESSVAMVNKAITLYEPSVSS